MSKGKHTLIVTGGRVRDGYIKEVLEEGSFDCILGVDGGLEYLYQAGIEPDYVVGDFDTVSKETLAHFLHVEGMNVYQFQPEKDATDTQLAIELALEIGSQEICIIGATGSRMDHVLGNIQILGIALEHDVFCYLLDPTNRIRLLKKGLQIKKEDQYGDYISLIPLTTTVTGVTLEGFKYPLYLHTFTSFDTLGISNEIVETIASIELHQGILMMIESKDG
ncbi:MAG TPA: thiamine diphosphokinase [Candidatus Merdenecus merdavium]|nr:thiamine diphosphokinase [Candidatus Merdenecus merdavium]